MKAFSVQIPDARYHLWEQLSPTDKQALETRLKRTLKAFVFEKNSMVIQELLQGKGPYSSEEELYNDVSSRATKTC